MPRKTLMATAMLAMQFLVAPAMAGVFGDDLTRCVVTATKSSDEENLVRWMFAAMSLHPSVKSMSSVTPAQRDELNKKVADLFVRLFAVDCREKAVLAIKTEGTEAVFQAFNVLGQAVARGLMTNSFVSGGLKSMNDAFEEDPRLKALMKGAGLPDSK